MALRPLKNRKINLRYTSYGCSNACYECLHLCERIRERGFSMPIIGITANVHKDDIENCFRAGMKHFIGKPVSEIKLYQTIIKWSYESPSLI